MHNNGTCYRSSTRTIAVCYSYGCITLICTCCQYVDACTTIACSNTVHGSVLLSVEWWSNVQAQNTTTNGYDALQRQYSIMHNNRVCCYGMLHAVCMRTLR